MRFEGAASPGKHEQRHPRPEGRGHLVRAGARVEYWADPPFDEMEIVLGVAQELAALALPARTQVLFREDGRILACVLGTDHEIEGLSFVRGTRIEFDGGRWQLEHAEAGYD